MAIIPGVYRHQLTNYEAEFNGEIPCEYGNQELLDTLVNFYSNEATRVFEYFEIPAFGENFTLVSEMNLPLLPPEYIAPLPISPTLLPEPLAPFVSVEPLLYRVSYYHSPSVIFTYPTPETATLGLLIFITIVITELKEKRYPYAPFVPIFMEAPFLFFMLAAHRNPNERRRNYG
jgi:hypothetical protein